MMPLKQNMMMNGVKAMLIHLCHERHVRRLLVFDLFRNIYYLAILQLVCHTNFLAFVLILG